MSVLGIDVGTSTCKGIVLNAGGEIIAQGQVDYAQQVNLSGSIAELPAEVFRDSVFALVEKLAGETAGCDPVCAIAFSTHGETLIPVDEKNEAVRPAMLSMDRRCAPQAAVLEERIGASRFYEITGTPIHSQYPMPKIMWMLENEAELVKRVKRYCSTQDYLHGCLGVPGYVDYSLASRFGGLDVKEHAWSKEILECVGIDESQLSRPVCAGTSIGAIPAEIAERLHLGKNVHVVAGGHDQPCASFGMGARAGAVTVSAGSYECAAIMTDAPLNDGRGMRYGLNSYCHVVPGKYVTLAFFASGLMVQWFIDRFCRLEKQQAEEAGKKVFSILEDMAPDGPTGICITPHIHGAMNPEWNERATARITGLTATDGIGEMYRAVLEGASCELDLNIRVLEKLSGKIERLVMSGGGAKSDFWMRLRADITGKAVYRVTGGTDASCMGAALLAGLGGRMFASYEEALEKVQKQLDCFMPGDAAAYAGQKADYLKLHRPGLLEDR
ncbi:MAG: hypothetical protein IJ466_00405 [Clostridia bacterium]|nr:hypothetical protein [Clostridia bacterium]